MVSTLIDTYPDRFAVVEYHVQDVYAQSWGEDRGDLFYHIWSDGIPWFAYDGLYDAWPISTYQSKLLSRQSVTTPVRLRVTVEPYSPTLYQATIRAYLEPGASSRDANCHAVLVQDRYPTTPSYSRNTFRKSTGVTTMTLMPGKAAVETRLFTIDAGWIASNMKVIAWVQTPNAQIPAEVYQAGQAGWPFDGDPLQPDYDLDNDVDLDDGAALFACLTGPAQPASLVCQASFDSDGDTDVDMVDWRAFAGLFTGP